MIVHWNIMLAITLRTNHTFTDFVKSFKMTINIVLKKSCVVEVKALGNKKEH